MGLLNALRELPEVQQLIRSGFLKAESAENPQAVKRAYTAYQNAVNASPAMKRRANQMGDTVKTVETLGQRNIVSPEDIYRAQYALVPVSGDTLATGHTIHSLAGMPVNDVVVGGGPLFGLRNKGLGWASMSDRAGAKQSHFDLAARESGRPVLGVYNRMGDKSHDFAAPVTQLMVEGARANKVPKTLWSALDEDVWKLLDVYNKEGVLTKKGKDRFIGFSRNPDDAYSQLLGENGFPKEGSGALRTAFMDRAGLAGYRNQGMPSRSEIMDAVTEPELRGVPIGGSGFGMFKAKPNASLLPHEWNKSYDAGIQGDWYGGLEQSIPLEKMFPDMYKEFAGRRNKKGELLSPQEIQGTFVADTGSYQLPTQQWLDNVSGFIEDRKRLAALGLVGASGFAGAQEKDSGGNDGLIAKAVESQPPTVDTTDASDPESALFQSAGGAGNPLSLQNLKNYGTDLLKTGKGLITGGAGIAGDTESLGRGLLAIPSRPAGQSRFDAFVGGMDQPTFLPSSKDVNRYINPLMPQSLQGDAGVPQQIGEFMAPATMLTKGAGLLGKAVKETAPVVAKGADNLLDLLPKNVPVGASVKPVANAPVSDLGFFSALEEAGLNLQRNKGTGQAFLNELAKAPNVKSEEIKWIGLDDYLKDKPNATREEVQKFIADNKVDVQEVTLGGDVPKQENMLSLNDIRVEPEGDQGRWFIESPTGSVTARVGSEQEAKEFGVRYFNSQISERNRIAARDADNTKFGQWTLPGGENYREILLTMPSNRPSLKNMSRAEYNAAIDAADKAGIKDYQSSHWDQPNVLAHLRVNDRVDADGKKMLLIEEVQSDWHQAGRDKGYATADINSRLKESEKELEQIGVQIRGLNNRMASLSDAQIDEFNKLAGERQKLYDRQGFLIDEGNALIDKRNAGVPDAPFKDNWYQLALKRALKYAADNGYERVGLTTGSRQIDRYTDELRANVDSIEYEPFKTDSGEIRYELVGIKNNEPVVQIDDMSYKDLQAKVGKEIAKKIKDNAGESLAADRPMRPDWMRLSTDNLSIGGEGMKRYYDEVYPQFLDKYGKKWGAKVGETSINANGKEPIRYIDITPEMRKGVEKGQPMFSLAAPIGTGLLSSQQSESQSKMPKNNNGKKQTGLLQQF